jgi:hypothetical protein
MRKIIYLATLSAITNLSSVAWANNIVVGNQANLRVQVTPNGDSSQAYLCSGTENFSNWGYHHIMGTPRSKLVH